MRIKNIFRNSFFSMISQFALLILGFFSQRALNLYMGSELVGMNGVISNVIAILSVTELGVATAVVYHLYGAIARQDEQEIAALMNLYRKAYYIFAAVIFSLGICFLPFIHLFMKNSSYSLGYIRVLYGIWLVRTVLSYLLSYRKSLLIADQKEYIASILALITNVLNYTTIIVLVTVTQKYLLALCLNTGMEVLSNLWINWYVEKKYPYLKKMRRMKEKTAVFHKIISDLKSIFVSRVSQKLLYCTDNLIISGFISVKTVGLYSNYCLITQSIANMLIVLSNSIQPTVGNAFTEKNHEKDYMILRQLTFAFFLIVSVGAAGLFTLITPFVTDFWLGKGYELSGVIVIICVANFAMQIMGLPLSMVVGVTGLFEKERNASVLAAGVNLLLSLGLVRNFGMMGVLLGTFLAYFSQNIYRFWIFFHHFLPGQNKKEAFRYLFDLAEYGALILLEVAAVQKIVDLVYVPQRFWALLISCILCCVIPTAVNLLVYFKSWRVKSLGQMIRGMRK